MVAPLVLGLVRAAPIIAKFLPKAVKFGRGLITKILPKTTKGKIFTIATLPTLVGFAVTPVGKKTAVQVLDPRKGFARGVGIGTKKDKEPSSILEGAKKAGLVGAVVGAAVVGAKAISKIPKLPSIKLPSRKEKVITNDDIISAVPIEKRTDILTEPTLGAVKPTPIPKVTPAIKNTFNPSIDIRFSKSRKFINQQVLIKS